MKRVIASAALFAAALAGGPAGAQQEITIGVSLPQDDNPFYVAMLRGVVGLFTGCARATRVWRWC